MKFCKKTKKICYDCGKAMWEAIIIYALQDLLAEAIVVYAAKTIGEFANSILSDSMEIGYFSLLKILLCLIAIIIGVPLIETIAEVKMFNKSFDYCMGMYRKFLQKKYDSIIDQEEGELLYRLDNDVTDFYLAFTDIAIKILSLPIVYVYLFASAYSVNVAFCMTVAVVGVIVVVIKLFSADKKRFYVGERSKYASQYRAKENELIENGKQFYFWNIYALWANKLKEDYRNYHYQIEKKCIVFETILSVLINFAVNIGNIIILIIGAILVANNRITPGAVAQMLGYYNIFISLNGKTVDLFSGIFGLGAYLERMKFFYTETERSENDAEFEKISKIEIVDLSCGYEGYEVFHNLNFKIGKNEKLLIRGENGSGKSTLLYHLSGLLMPMFGRIEANGKELDSNLIYRYRKRVSFFSQECYLFNGTVFDNICIGKIGVSREEVIKVAREMGIVDLLDKEISNNGSNLSGGEKQKIGIARALIRQSDVLIIDEPENNLDVDTKKRLIGIIGNYVGIVIFVSHDNEIMSCADNVVILS